MKKALLTVVFFSTLLIGCNENKSKESMHDHHSHTASAEEVLNNEWVNDMALNDGKRWIANEETNVGVKEMIRMIEESDPATVADYHELATQLNETKNYVVKKCTMKGESHDYLHVFLYPLMTKIEALGKVSEVNQGAEIREHIIENLYLYHDYFE